MKLVVGLLASLLSRLKRKSRVGLRELLVLGFSGVAVFLLVSGEPVPEALMVLVAFLCGSYFGSEAARPNPVDEPDLTRPFVPGDEEDTPWLRHGLTPS
jgi:hypothetical protein